MNIPCIPEKTICRGIEASGVYLNAFICSVYTSSPLQTAVLDGAAPDSWWWVKADSVDVVSGLEVSVRGT